MLLRLSLLLSTLFLFCSCGSNSSLLKKSFCDIADPLCSSLSYFCAIEKLNPELLSELDSYKIKLINFNEELNLKRLDFEQRYGYISDVQSARFITSAKDSIFYSVSAKFPIVRRKVRSP